MRREFRPVTVEPWLAHRDGLIARDDGADVGRLLKFRAAQTEPLPDRLEGRRVVPAWVPELLAWADFHLHTGWA
jgi:hypothetical protein